MAEEKINSNTYKVEPMLAFDALRLKAKLLKVIGGGVDRLPAILEGAGKDKSEEAKAASNGAAVAAFSDIFTNGDPDEMAGLVKEVLEVAMVKRPSGYDELDMDTFTSDDLAEMFQVVVFVLRTVFGPLFSGLLSNGKLKKALKV